ncbi:MAG TPA: DUF808 domain-containing protein [Candidatus Acidoferrum sp.]|nr:DUF808 domain-containing protein [Candidatus Acidoferrum sp.]
MAGTSLLALIDDIAMMLDDVAILTKVAAKKTAGVLGDDLALNAQQVAGVKADRELPVVWAVAKGSLLNKAILVPAALAISALAPWAVLPLLMVGGAFLCYEGFEKLTHKFLHSRDEDTAHHAELLQAVSDPTTDLVAMEKEKIKGAVRTDLILSAEIIVISLGTVATAPFVTRVSVLTGVALIMTVGVYGLVAGIVKLDDGGLSLSQRTGNVYSARMLRAIGAGILAAAPWLMKSLAVGGTAAMFLVGGGILIHGIPGAHSLIRGWVDGMAPVPVIGGALQWLTPVMLDGVAGILAGALVLAMVSGARRVIHPRRAVSQ